jgi:co-chaperonin GroES (HSP10)
MEEGKYMRMLRNLVLVQEINTQEKETAGGIILTGTPDKKHNAPAFVIATGPEVTAVVPTQQVYVDWSKGTIVEIDGKQAVSISENDILAVIEGE